MNDINILGTQIISGISLITAVKNRTEHLTKALETWLSSDEIDEIIIVDWSSDESLIPKIRQYQNDKIKLVIALDQAKWSQTKAFNLSAKFASRERILKVDADIEVLKGFFPNHQLNQGIFFTGNWATAKNSNETHLNGSVYLMRKDFFKINGYNELFQLYGYDDTDLYLRLENIGLKRLDFNHDFLFHIEHENRIVTSFPETLSKLSDAQKADLSILMNKHLLTKSYYSGYNQQMTNYTVMCIDTNIFTCTQLSEVENNIPEEVIKESVLIAIKERLRLAGQEFSDRLFNDGNLNEIIDLFYIFHNKNNNQTFQNIYNLIIRLDKMLSKDFCQKKQDAIQFQKIIQDQNKQLDLLRTQLEHQKSTHNRRISNNLLLTIQTKLMCLSKTFKIRQTPTFSKSQLYIPTSTNNSSIVNNEPASNLEQVKILNEGSDKRLVGSMDFLLEDLKFRGLTCKTIMDVGANRTNWSRMAQKIFPESCFYLIEPQIEMKDYLDNFCKEFSNSVYFMMGVGANDNILTFTIWDDLYGSSFLPKPDNNLRKIGKQRDIKVTTIGNLIENYKLAIPDLIKLDIQGFELEALKGASITFRKTEVFIIEVSLFQFEDVPGIPLISEVINFMLEKEYVVYDFPGFLRRPFDGALGQCDICFVKQNGFLRTSNKWA